MLKGKDVKRKTVGNLQQGTIEVPVLVSSCRVTVANLLIVSLRWREGRKKREGAHVVEQLYETWPIGHYQSSAIFSYLTVI